MQLRKKFAVAVAVTASLGIGATAFAFWSSSGTGSGTAVTGQPEGVTITGSLDPLTTLFPGASVLLTVTLSNTNPFAVTVGAVGGTVVVPGDGDPDINDVCGITIEPSVGNTVLLASGDPADTKTATVTVKMDPGAETNQDVCKGRLVNITFTTSAPT